MRVYASFVDWSKGSCQGLDTNIFYDVEEIRQASPERKAKMDRIRQLCTSCPIFEKCLEWGFENESYGVWGGMTSAERDAVAGVAKMEWRNKTLAEMGQFGVSETEIKRHIRPKSVSPYDRWSNHD
jgi:hypothetical protein